MVIFEFLDPKLVGPDIIIFQFREFWYGKSILKGDKKIILKADHEFEEIIGRINFRKFL